VEALDGLDDLVLGRGERLVYPRRKRLTNSPRRHLFRAGDLDIANDRRLWSGGHRFLRAKRRSRNRAQGNDTRRQQPRHQAIVTKGTSRKFPSLNRNSRISASVKGATTEATVADG